MGRLEALFDRFRETGDAGALAEVFDALAPDLLRLARHLVRDRGDAEDLVQATFLAAIERRASFDTSRELKPWLAGILVREAARVRRSRAREVDPRRLDSRTVAAPGEALAARELSDALALAFEQLTPAEREVLVPVLLDGKRAVEVARELGARPDTVHMRIHRGLAHLRKLLPAGFGLGVLAKLADARSLAGVRRSVLEGARTELAGAGAASLAGASAGVVAAGGLAVKNIMIVSVALLVTVAAFVGWSRIEERAHSPNATGSDAALARAAEPDTARTTAAGDELVSRLAIEARPEPSANTLLEMVEPAGAPVAGARVAFLGRGGVVRAATTDDKGSCELPREGEVELFVLREAALAVSLRADLSAARSRVELPPDREVSGTITLLDGSSPRGLSLALESDRSPPAVASAPEELFEALGKAPADRSEVRLTLDADGGFRFRGLPDDWTGTLRLPASTWLRDEASSDRARDLVLAAPASGLLLALELRPSIHGRLIDAQSGSPIAGARGDAAIASPTGTWLNGFESDADGRFRIVLENQRAPTSLRLPSFRAADGRPYSLANPLPLAVDLSGVDLGDVACDAVVVRTIRLRVLDHDERAVSDAQIVAGPASPETTDDEGRAELRFVPADLDRIRIGAHGCAVEALEAGALGERETVVRLKPTNRLAVRIEGDVPAATWLRVAVVADVPLFAPKLANVPESRLARVEAGEFMHGRSERGGAHFESVFRPEEGRVAIDELRTDAAFEVRLLDPFGRTLASARCAPLGATERRDVPLALPAGLRSVSGRVLDPEGRALDRCHVLYSGEGGGFGVVLGTDGRFHLDHVAGGEFHLRVSKRGFAPRGVSSSEFPADGSDLEVRLGRAHDVRIVLVDASGDPVRGARVDVGERGQTTRLEELMPGEFLLRDVPAETLELSVEVGGARYSRQHASTETLARFELPRHGALTVAWSGPPARRDGEALYVVLRPLDEGRTLVREWVSWQAAGEHRFESLLPGAWRLSLETAPLRGDVAETEFAAVLSPRTIDVRAGQATRVELGR